MPPAPVNKWIVALSVTFGTLMGTIDASIVNVAVPHLRAGVGATVEQITWISTGFIIATVLVMPLTAFLGRMFGQKRVYLFCLALFVAGSALCGMARSLEALVLFRFVQGFGAGALQPTEQAILRQTFPPHEQGMAMALFGMAVMIGPALGPTLGGYIVDHYSWPWIFYINLPVGVLGFFMVSRFVHEPPDIAAANRAVAEKQRKHMDWAGIALLSAGLGSLQYMLEEGNAKDWFQSHLIQGALLVSAFALTAFVIRELTATAPVVNLRLFKDRVFLSGTLVSSVMFAILFSITFLLPLFMQMLLGYSAVQSGLTLMPRTLIMMVVTPIIGKLYNKLSPRVVVGFGICMFAVAAWQMSHFTLSTSAANIIGSLLVQGIGFACLFVPLTTVSLSSVKRSNLADATGLNSLFRQVGGSIGLAVFATLLSRQTTAANAALAEHVTATDLATALRLTQIQAWLGSQGLDPASAKTASLGVLAGIVRRQAMVLSFEKLFLIAGILFLCVLPLLLFLKADRPARPGPQGDLSH